ncbi:hypothetical protein [Brumimicrobium mesophilum]|uniref:hypothetical protein n=1 Tax=Brumimicrobium mesophilum TaxID=392717 RepID=UPI000D142A28|nr:hypothetical protein [Brumimicrobium mesophilum]
MKSLLLIAFTFAIGFAIAQPRVVTFESDEGSREDQSGYEMNVFKISLFELAAGDFPIYYERVLSNSFSAEASLGLTFGDYTASIFSDYDSPFNYNIDAKYGFSFSLALRFYPIASLEDFYISPEFKFRNFNWSRDIDQYNPYPPYENVVTQTVDETRTYLMPRINLGYITFYDNNLSFDWHIGVGMNTPTESVFNYQTLQVQSEKLNTRPRFHFGFKIGYVF